MTSIKISELIEKTNPAPEDFLIITDVEEQASKRITVAQLLKVIGISDELVECGHCTQWTLEKRPCASCGAPVGPKEAKA